MVGGGWVVDGCSLAPRDGRVSSKYEAPPVCFLFRTGSSRTNQLTAPCVPGVDYCCTYCCTAVVCCSAVCSKGLVGGWAEGALRRLWWAGGPFRTWESFFRPVGNELVFLFLKYRPPAGAWESHRPHCCTPLSFTTVRTAALPYCCPVIFFF